MIVALRLPVRHRLLAADRRDRLVVEPDLGHDRRHAAADLPDLPRCWAGSAREYRLAALSIAGVVCIAASNGGTTSQDLKTGFLVGATPRSQQIAILIGALTSALVIGVHAAAAQRRPAPSTPSEPEYLPTVHGRPSPTLTETAGRRRTARRTRSGGSSTPIPGAQPGKYLVDDTGRRRYLDRSGDQRPASTPATTARRSSSSTPPRPR